MNKPRKPFTIVFTPDNPDRQADIQSGDISNIEILDFLHSVSTDVMAIYAKKVIADYEDLTGEKVDMNTDLEPYLAYVRKNKPNYYKK